MPPTPTPRAPDYQLICVWGDRLADAQSCAVSLLSFLAAIEPDCPPGTRWHTLGRKDALLPLPTDPDGCRISALQPGNGGKLGVPAGALLPAVGFHALLVTASGQPACALHLTLGMQGPHAHNELSLRFPQQGAAAQAWLSPERMQTLFGHVIDSWQPDLAYIYHTDIRDDDVGYPLPIYWYAYARQWPDDLPQRLGTLPAGAQSWPADGAPGQILRSTPELYDRHHAPHQAASDALKLRLKAVGLLPPPAPFL